MSKVIVYTNDEGQVVTCHPAPGFDPEEVLLKDCPTDKNPHIEDLSSLPSDTTFRDAWVESGSQVIEDLTKSKEISHGWRREKRQEEFKPHDDIIMKQIPGADATAAEEARAEIRTRYETIQSNIDASTSTDELRTILSAEPFNYNL